MRLGWVKRAARYPVGYRGRVLITLGVLWIFMGFSSLDSVVRPWLLHEVYLPGPARFAAWAITGLLAIAYGAKRIGQHDQIGWLALYVMPAERAFSYTVAWLDAALPFGDAGYSRAWGGVAVYVAILTVIYLCASWPEPTLHRDSDRQ